MPIDRSAMGPARAELDTLIQRFWERGITPVVSTNGRHPDADIEVTKIPADQAQSKDELHTLESATITKQGQQRLERAGG